MKAFDRPRPDGSAERASKGVRLWPERWRWRLSLVALIALVALAAAVWLGRERIAGNLIDDALADNGIEASYDIVEITPQAQVIANLVIGDPGAPDLTAERVTIDIVYSFGAPEIGRITLMRPRLFGTYRGGELSFGTLDPLLFAESEEPAGLPELDIAVRDGRALIESDYGDFGIKLEGAGRLDDGFAGEIALTAPGIGTRGCGARTATAYGELTSADGRLGFEGPVRLREVNCAEAQLESADIAAQLTMSRDLAALEGELGLRAAEIGRGDVALAQLAGDIDLAWRFAEGEGGAATGLSLRHDLEGTGLASPYAGLAAISAEGTLRSIGGFARSEWRARFAGEGVDVARGRLGVLAEAQEAASGSFVGALIGKLRRALPRALGRGSLAGEISLRQDGESLRLLVPEARLATAAGDPVIAVSRLSFASRGDGAAPRLTGNILTGGPGLPRITARIQQVAGGAFSMRMSMAEYSEGRDRLAISRVEARQDAGGTVRFDGTILAHGAIPGGAVRGLTLPLEGTWSPRTGLAIGRRCTESRIDALSYAQLTLEAQTLDLCPADGGAILAYDGALRIAAETRDLALRGALGGTPARIAAERARFTSRGGFALDELVAAIGPPGNAVRLSAGSLTGALGGELAGQFADGSAAIDAVPLDLANLSGNWRFDKGTLRIGEGAFTLSEREGAAEGPEPRFEPLEARGATLVLADGTIRAEAALRHPESQRLVTDVTVTHNLASGRGRAVLDVPGVLLDKQLQPDQLSYLADGVIELARGTVTGEGLIEWDGSDITSTGSFTSEGLDFAAAFGPVQRLSGTLEFTDLLGLTTAPGQRLAIGAVNPGIEVIDGEIVFALDGGTVVDLEEGRWPFFGGTLVLRPTTLEFGGRQGQDYVFELIGLDAAVFVAEMELDNFDATGTFDGTVPITFDGDGNGFIRGGLLLSRAPGGNVSYVGELTYEDMGAMANFAFQALRSLDYRQMSIELDGSVAGEILTRFVIDGVTQGASASRNFITDRIARLPIRFNINVRSENFSQLALIVRGLSDATAFGDAVDQGVFRFEDGVLVRPDPAPPPLPEDSDDPEPPANWRDEAPVQPPESDDLP
ncbi:intermembrane phospholipid transport protein YdbH family protein [Erythrobacter sp.]|jgi:hypothetical protein|uniref:intermembrane phospholipid transport protein YdbH family protein n=1 Tax=Erythrobacter sp. TaxID=1042 RepID=UPI002EB5C1D7|nr:YdbH domain-containing protein [Erythrobacter sp.]